MIEAANTTVAPTAIPTIAPPLRLTLTGWMGVVVVVVGAFEGMEVTGALDG
jgi:hypothetical protein